MHSHRRRGCFGRALRLVLPGAVLSAVVAAPAFAQRAATADPNPGAITLTAGLDAPTLYYFRGIRQESEPRITLWPYGDVGIALMSGEGAVKRLTLNVGVWNSLHTGTSGSKTEDRGIHYEEDFYTTLTWGFDKGVSMAASFIAYTSANGGFATVKELDIKVSKSGMMAPYGLIALELSDKGQADAGEKKGTYVELGVGPNFPLAGGKVTLAIPVKVGLSAKDYYERRGDDKKFGFFDVGGLATMPLTRVPARLGSWNVHVAADFIALGAATKALNLDKDGEAKSSQVVALFGIGMSY